MFRYFEQVFGNWLFLVTIWLFGSGYTLSLRVWGVKWPSRPWSGSWGVTTPIASTSLVIPPTISATSTTLIFVTCFTPTPAAPTTRRSYSTGWVMDLQTWQVAPSITIPTFILNIQHRPPLWTYTIPKLFLVLGIVRTMATATTTSRPMTIALTPLTPTPKHVTIHPYVYNI